MAIGSLIVKIGADISGIRRDAKKGAESLTSLQGAATGLGTALKAIAVGLVAKELVSMVSGAMKAIDVTAKLSRQLGGTIDGLQGLRLAANLAGVDTGALSSAMDKLNQRLGEAARKGSGEAFDAFERLGLSARKLSELDVDERMATIADRMVELGFTSQQTADTLRSLGIRQGAFAILLSEGGDAIRAARQEIEDFGLSLSAVDAAKVEEANDALSRVKLASTAIAQRLAVELSPVITAISNQFIDAAKDAEGLRRTVDTIVEVGVKGFGFLGDAVKGVHLVFKAVELAGWGLGGVLVDVFRVGVNAVALFIDGAITNINTLIESANRLPGIDITPVALLPGGEFMTALDGLSENMRATTADVFEQLKALATEEWPSDKAAKLFAEIQAAAQVAAEEVVKHRQTIMDVGGTGDESTDGEDKEAEKLRERLESQLNVLREHIMTAEELESERFAGRLDQLNQALDLELLSWAEFATLSEGIEERHMETLAKLREEGMDKINDITANAIFSGIADVLTGFQSLTSQLTSVAATAATNAATAATNATAANAANADMENRKAFDKHKGFAIADALVSGALGVARTLGAYEFPINLGFAAAHAATAAAQVAVIASQQFSAASRTVAAPAASGGGGGGGSRGSAQAGQSGGSGVTGGGSQLVQIGLTGDTFSRASVIALIEQMNEAISDGARIVVA